MEIEVEEKGNILLKRVYNSIVLESDSGERFTICMRDSGFEFYYGDEHYTAQSGFISILGGFKLGIEVSACS